MRTSFIQHLIKLAAERPEIFLVVGDLGFSVVEPFAEKFPDRFLNAGVAEQNMTGVAAGLASEGYHVFTYSIANFPTLRCLEQIRNDVCYHNLSVTIVAVGGGIGYGSLGYSHHGVQDLAVMRTLPNITIMAPGDPGETRQCLDHLVDYPGPSYLRLGKAGEPGIHSKPVDFSQGLVEIHKGKDPDAIVCTGSALKIGKDASDLCRKTGLDPSLFSCPVIKPIRMQQFNVLESYRRIITIEDHVAEGGLASILREYLADKNRSIFSMCLTSDSMSQVGSEQWLREASKLHPQNVVNILSNSRNHHDRQHS